MSGETMSATKTIARKQNLEARAAALLKRLRQRSLSHESFTEFEIRSVLKEIRTIKTLNFGSADCADTHDRVSIIMEQAIAEAKNIVAESVAYMASGRD